MSERSMGERSMGERSMHKRSRAGEHPRDGEGVDSVERLDEAPTDEMAEEVMEGLDAEMEARLTEEQAEQLAAERAAWNCMANWTQAERDVWAMGPFDGGIPGMVRRVRRILDVSQRGLAALLHVSQSVVARWETGRTSPRMSVMEQLLRLARLRMRFEDQETGEPVGPMRADGARRHGGSRYPAHVDLTARGWWVPRRLRAMTSIEAFRWRDHSRRVGDPGIRYVASRYWRGVQREILGTPDDHPAVHQLAAEVRSLEEEAEKRAERDKRRRVSRDPAA